MKFTLEALKKTHKDKQDIQRCRRMLAREASKLKSGAIVLFRYADEPILHRVRVTSVQKMNGRIEVNFKLDDFWFRDSSNGRYMRSLLMEN